MNRLARLAAPWIITGAVVVAIVLNLAVYAIGRLAGGSFLFSTPAGEIEVMALTVAGFTAVPLILGLAAVAILGRWRSWVFPTALIVAPLLEVVTIFVGTLPAGFDAPSAVALSSCHLTLVPVTIVALLALRARAGGSRLS
ncbi:MAG: hypothetical protein RI885_1912 [Actinomycetota bacterium]